MKKRKTIAILAIIFSISIVLLHLKERKNNGIQEDNIFFKSVHIENNKKILTSEETELKTSPKALILPTYKFDMSNIKIGLKTVNLLSTINNDTLMNGKIAPGTSGNFKIVLETNKKTKYKIKFKSESEKPKNLNFKINEKDRKYENLENIEEDLQGEITKRKNILINWEWEYEKNNIENVQDTLDGEKLRKYNFTIYVYQL